MANFFDTFDSPKASVAAKKNFFDTFDEAPAAPAPVQMAPAPAIKSKTVIPKIEFAERDVDARRIQEAELARLREKLKTGPQPLTEEQKQASVLRTQGDINALERILKQPQTTFAAAPAAAASDKLPSRDWHRTMWEEINPGGDYDAAMKARKRAPTMAVQDPDSAPQKFTLKEALAKPAVAQAPVAQAQTAPAPATEPALAEQGAAFGIYPKSGARTAPVVTAENKPKRSVLESLRGPETAAPVPEDKMLRPEFVQAVEAKLNAMPKDQRADALALMLKRPDVYGRAAKVVAARYAMLDKVVSPTAQNFDPRLEAQTKRFEKQGRPADLAELDAKQQALSGGLRSDFDQMTEANAKKVDAASAKAKLRTGAQNENYGITDFAKDTGLDVSKGVVKFGETYVGLLDLTSGGAAGRVLAKAGYDPKSTNEFLTGFQSLTRQNADKNVEEATGFLDTLKELAVNPTALIGGVAESLPGTVAAGAVGGQFVRFLVGKAAAEASSLGLRGASAEKFIADKVKEQAFKIASVSGGAEGVQSAGSIAEAGRQSGKDWNEYVLPALAAGFGTAAIGAVSGKVAQKFGIGDIETNIAARSAGVKGVGVGEGPFLTKFFKEIAKEGFLEEMPQSAQEQIFTNLATGRPWDEGVDKAAAQGLITGIAMAGGHSVGVQVLQKTSSAIKGAPPEQRQGYKQDTSTDGLAELMARSKGFLTPEARTAAPAATEDFGLGEIGAAAPVADAEFDLGSVGAFSPGKDTTATTDVGEMGAVTPGEDTTATTDVGEMGAVTPGEVAPAPVTKTEAPVVPAEREARIKEIASKIEDITGATAEDAIKIATQRVEREEAENVPTTVPTESVGEPDRTSATVAEQPTGATAAKGPTGTEPGGVVSTGTTAEGPAVGEGTQPAALTAEEQEAKYQAAIKAEDEANAVFDAKVAEVKSVGRANAQTAFETANSEYGGDINAAIDSLRQNTQDTLAETRTARGERPEEQGTLSDRADQAFDAEIKKLKAKAEAPVATAETEAPTEAPAEAPVVNPPANEVVEQAKAALAEIKKPRGRPSLVLTPEQEASKATERKASNAANERTKRAAEKQTTALESAINTGNQPKRRAAYKELLKLRASGTGTDTVRNAIKATLEKHSNRFTPAELETLKREAADEKGVKTLQSIEGAASIAKADPKFSKFTNGVQAITHIIKTGTPFQKLVAQRIRSFVGNVNFVVLEKDSPVPDRLKTPRAAAEWAKARGMYVQNDATGERTVYLRGASFGSGHGVSNVVVIHELLHAATNQKLYLGLKALERGFSTTSAITQAAGDIQRIMESAEARFNQLAAAGELPPEIRSLKKYGSIFTSPQEFLAYGMSDEAMQTFLLGAKGSEGGSSFFNRFVGAIRKTFNIGENENNAMMDLVLATDKLLNGQKSGIMRMLEAGNKALAQRSFAEPKTSKAALTPEEEADQLDKETSKAAKAVVNSREGEDMAKAVTTLATIRNPVRVWRALSGAWDKMSNGARSKVSHFFYLGDIARSFGEYIPALQDVSRLTQQMSGMEQSILRGTSKIAEQVKRFYRAHPDARIAFENLVHTSTLAKYDPAKVGNRRPNEPLDTAFAALPEQGQQLYRDLRDYYREMNELQLHIITENLDQLDIPDADRKKLIAGIREAYQKENVIEPYFPLMRHGDFILKIGKPGSANYLSMRFDTEAEQERAAYAYADSQGMSVDELEQDGYIVKGKDINGVRLRRSIDASSELLKAGYAAIDAAPIGYAIDPTPVRAAMKDNLYQAYLASMPEGSIRKMFIHREGTAGFSSDVLRNLNSYGAKASKSYSKLKFGTPIRQAVDAAERGLVGPNKKYEAFVTRAKELVADNLEPPQQHEFLKGFEKKADVVAKLTFIRNLTSWSSAMLQPSEIFLKVAPVLAGNHGPAAIPALTQRMKLWNQLGVVQKNADGTTTWRAPSIEFARGLTPRQRRAVRDMNAMYGVTNDTFANDVFSQARKTGSKLDSKWVENSKDAANTLIMGGLMHHGERLSREVTFLTSYDLYESEFTKEGFSPKEAHDRAVYSAVQEVTEALGSNSTYDKPMIMRGGTGKLLTMYKSFPLTTSRLLIGNFFRMLPLMNKEGKVAAATKFFGVMGTHLLAGGLTALPLFGVVMAMLGAAWAKWGRDPDAPAEMKDIDYPTWWKSVYMDKVFGSTHIADVLKTGLINKMTGSDVASRLSLNDMFFRELPQSKNLTETATNIGLAILGPVWSTGMDVVKGVELAINGKIELALEKLSPASVSKLLIAHRYATEGVEDSRGVQLVEKGNLSNTNIAMQALGFRPAKAAEAQELGFKASAAEKVIDEEKGKIAKDIKDNFRESIDLDKPVGHQQRFEAKFEETLDKLREFNGKYPEKAFARNAVFELIISDAKLKANLEANAGVKITPKNARLLRDTVDKAIEALKSYDKKEQ